MIAAALLGALSDRARGGRLHAVTAFGENAPSTKVASDFLNTIAKSKNVLIVLDRNDELSLKSVRNLPNVHVLNSDQLNAYDVLVSDDIVFTQEAITSFVNSKKKDEVN